MSDQSQGPGWWQASDGRWYPPEKHPNAQTAQPADVGIPPGSPRLGMTTAGKWILGSVLALLVGLIVLTLASPDPSRKVEARDTRVEERLPFASTTTAPEPTTTEAPATTAAPVTAAPATSPPETTSPPPTTSPPTTQQESYVHPGAFCSTPGASGYSENDVPMTCATESCDEKTYDRPRWRRTQC